MRGLASQPPTGSQPERWYAYLLDSFDLDVIKTADWIVDLGLGAGIHGGEVVAQGPPERIPTFPRSLIGRYLAPLLAARTAKAS